MNIDKGGCDPKPRKRVCHQIIAATVNCFLRDNMSAVLSERLQCICNRSRAGSKCQSCGSAFQSRSALFQNLLRRVCQATINISGIRKSKTCRRMRAVVKNIRSCRINRYCACICDRIRRFLANVKLKRFKSIF